MTREALTVVIVGATGHLAQTKLFPSLFALYKRGFLPSQIEIVAFSRREWTDKDFWAFTTKSFGSSLRKEKDFKKFLSLIRYHHGYFEDQKSFESLYEQLEKTDLRFGCRSKKLLYLALSPDSYTDVVTHLGRARDKKYKKMDIRLLIEKPFGKDLLSARKLQRVLDQHFTHNEVFRVDHYLGKEALHFFISTSQIGKKSLIDPKKIESVHAELLEKNDVEGRHEFYDTTGALSDVGQNHLMVMVSTVLALVTDQSRKTVQKKRELFLKTLFIEKSKDHQASHAQYRGYTKDVGHDTKTETYFRVEMRSKKFKDVPIILEAGKALSKNSAQVSIFLNEQSKPFILRIQPQPVLSIPHSVGTLSVQERMNAYGNVFLAAMTDDQTYFPSVSEIYSSWKLFDELKKILLTKPLRLYKKGMTFQLPKK